MIWLGIGLIGIAVFGLLLWAILKPKKNKNGIPNAPTQATDDGTKENHIDKIKLSYLVIWNIVLSIAVLYGFISGIWTMGKKVDNLTTMLNRTLNDVDSSLDAIDKSLGDIESELYSIEWDIGR